MSVSGRRRTRADAASQLEAARSALGATYGGWKGGDYTMSEWSEVHLAIEGTTGEPLSSMAVKYLLSTALPTSH